jgi:hypothetical protein
MVRLVFEVKLAEKVQLVILEILAYVEKGEILARVVQLVQLEEMVQLV